MAYEDTRGVPNVVVDGSPNDATVVTLTHWPGIAQPAGVGADLSAQMAFAALDRKLDLRPADVVTNNHFDQDGLVSVHVLVDPEVSLAHRELLVDVAAAGDFATFRDRRAARASMAISRLADVPYDSYAEYVAATYERALPMLLPLVLDPDRHRDLWAEEDEQLDASERALGSGTVTIRELADVDLAVVEVPERLPALGGHRFGGERFDGLHPMALHNATERLRLLLVRGRTYQYTDRYETWVQLRSRRPRPRVDLRPLAAQLTAAEPNATSWSADAPGSLTPTLRHGGESALAPATVEGLVVAHLRHAPPAWDPYA